MEEIKECWINENGNFEMTPACFHFMLEELEKVKESLPNELFGATYCCAITTGDGTEKIDIELPKALAFGDCLRRALGGASVKFDHVEGGCRDDWPS
ncbi:hypothetical protein ASG98_18700 [Bacillus sp. Soil531]|uniref:Uncharacterized protein n=1 Tax=Priestia megaterium TaxID=1404 RepID=A0ABD4X2B8_PRIMG|nr:hypothetical protein [Priestia megaterium]KRF54043.1 hypothetical protein ASG98_18700 [Bacillus sp. Soil531]MDD9786612.1 hypothetical protein [Priestia megaterium]